MGEKTSMFQQMIKNYITFYSLLFSFNMFVQVHYKDSCITMTLHTPHKKFIVNKHNFKWNYQSLGMIPYHLYVVYHNYNFFGLNLSIHILRWYMIMIENIRSKMYIVLICKVIEHFIIYLCNSNYFETTISQRFEFCCSTSIKFGDKSHTIMMIYGMCAKCYGILLCIVDCFHQIHKFLHTFYNFHHLYHLHNFKRN